MKPLTAHTLAILRDRGSLTALEALYAGCGLRLSGRIYELRAAGYPITSEIVKTPEGQHVARYRLVPE